MALISTVIITKNEEKNIARCLDSLKGIADEIMVLDSGSTDKTVEICHQYGVKVIHQTWMGYSATKNLGNDLCQGPWILSMDADEALSDELKASILAVKNNLSGAYSFNRLAFYCGKPIHHCGWYPDVKVRLFPKGKAKWLGEFVHEELVTDQPVTHLKGDLLHYTYYTEKEHIERSRKYADLAAKEMAEKEKSGLMFKFLFSPSARFIKMYVLRLGFLDGKEGYRICRIAAMETRLKYSEAMKMIAEKKKNKSSGK